MARDSNKSELAACLASIDLMIERAKLLAETIEAHPNQSVSSLPDAITFPEVRSLDLLCKGTFFLSIRNMLQAGTLMKIWA